MLSEALPDGHSVVVPVFQASGRIEELVRRVLDVLRGLSRPYEVLLVNDGSADDSWKKIVALADAESQVRGVDLVRNFGQHNALLVGIRQARFGTVVTLDDDLQFPPEEIPRLLGALTDDVDVVYGTPRSRRQPLIKRAASLVTRMALQRMMGVEAARNVSAFRAFRTEIRSAFADFALPEFSLDVLLSWGARGYASVPVEHQPRQYGASNYTTRTLVRHSINMVVGFSLAPLRLASILGFTAVGLALGLLSYLFAHYIISGSSVPGFPFLAGSICLFGGVQLLILGVIGEYLAKVFQRSMGKPPYAVRASTPDDDT